MFMNGKGFNYVYPWKSKKQHPEALVSFIIGIPQMIASDGGRDFTKKPLMRHANNTTCRRNSQSHTAHSKMLLKQAFVRSKRVHDENFDRVVHQNDFGHMLPSGLPTSDA